MKINKVCVVLMAIIIISNRIGFAAEKTEVAIEIITPLESIVIHSAEYEKVSSVYITPGSFFKVRAVVENNSPTSRTIYLEVSLKYQDGTVSRMGSFQKLYMPHSSAEAEVFGLIPDLLHGSKILIEATEILPSVAYYVSPDGNDNNDGTPGQPFKTINRARDEIRMLKQTDGLSAEGVTVYLLEGEYPVDQTISFNNSDSGTTLTPIVYSAYPGADVYLTGAYDIAGSAFTPVTDPDIVRRINPSAVGQILQADLKELGINNYGSVMRGNPWTRDLASTAALYVDDEMQTLARWPNQQYALTSAPITQSTSEDGGSFKNTGGNIEAWTEADDVWVRGYWYWDWFEDNMRVKEIDVLNKRMVLENSTLYGIGANKRYYVYNLLEELDSPGEWYLDRQKGILYYYPIQSIIGKKIRLSKLENRIISIENCNNISFYGINFENTRGVAIDINNSNNILIAGGIFRGIGAQAVNITGGSNCGVLSSTIYDCGRGGVYMSGGVRETLTNSNHYVNNCEIYNFCTEISTYAPAVYTMGCGNTVTNNKIYDGPHSGILIEGNEHNIENNELYNLCTETDDAGAVYGGRDWTARGNKIQGNLFHDIYGLNNTGSHAVYFDDMMSGGTVTNNIFYNVYCGVYVNGGRNITVQNNIIANSIKSIYQVDLWDSSNAYDPEGELMLRYEKMPVTSELWMSRYPNVSNIPDDQPEKPKYNNFSNNLIYKTPGVDYSNNAAESGTFENNLQVIEDPGFKNESANDFSLKEDSQVYKLIPNFKFFSNNAGLYPDRYRKRN